MCVSCFLSVCWEHNQIIIWEEINFYTWMVYYICVFSTCWLCRSTCFRNGFSAWRVLAQTSLSCLKKKLQVGESSCDYTHGVLKRAHCTKRSQLLEGEMLELMFHDWCCFWNLHFWKCIWFNSNPQFVWFFVVAVRALEWMAVNIHCVFQRKKLWLSGSCRSIRGWRGFFYWFPNSVSCFQNLVAFSNYLFCFFCYSRLCKYLKLNHTCFPCPCNMLCNSRGFLHEGKCDWVLAETGKKRVDFFEQAFFQTFSVLNCLHIWMKIKIFTLLAFCSSVEFKQLINFVIHHLPSSLDFCTFTNKTVTYVVLCN